MHDREFEELREIIQRRPLTPEDSARLEVGLQRHPGQRAQWETEAALSRLLHQLPDTPLPSNFNAQVRAALQSPDRTATLAAIDWRRWMGLRPIPACATAVAIVLLAWGGYAWLQDYHRDRMATSVIEVSRSVSAAALVAQLPPVEILQDFEAIQRLSQIRLVADEELLAALE